MTDETNYNDGNWHRWNGGECPVHPDSVVDAVWHDENQLTTGIRQGRAFGGAWHNQILKFRVTKEHREPREFWLGCAGGYRHTFETPDAAETYKRQNSGAEIIHVREVIE